jgi:hypothetical protein
MKNKTIYILSLLLVLVYSQTKAQSADRTLKETFLKENLTQENLNAFESRAEQKIRDYANYIEIVSDKKYDSNLRKEAVSSALRLFSDTENEIKEYSGQEKKLKLFKIKEYFNTVAVSPFQKQVLEIKELKLINQLQKGTDNVYRGKVSFIQNMKGYNIKGELIFVKNSKKNAEIVLKKVKKQFGEKIEEIWEVFIGNIN